MKEFMEIRIDHYDESLLAWAVDGWYTDDDNEEGVVIAYIDALTARVFPVLPDVLNQPRVKEAIESMVSDIKEQLPCRIKLQYDTLSIERDTDAGVLVAEVEKKEDIGYDAIYVGLRPNGHEDSYIDLAGVRTLSKDFDDDLPDEYGVRLMTFGNPASEDYDYKVDILKTEFDDALSEYDEKEDDDGES